MSLAETKIVKLCREGLALTSVPWMQARLASYLWFRPQRKTPSSHFLEWRQKSIVLSVPGSKCGPLRYWPGNVDKPDIRLVHGWGGRWDQFSLLLDQLTASGYGVYAQDFPAHGEAPGNSTDLAQWIHELGQSPSGVSRPCVYICHSFGLASVAYSILNHRLPALGVVAINPPTRFDFLMESFLRKNRLSEDLAPILEKRISARVTGARSMSDVDVIRLADQVPLLYLADQGDREVPYIEHELVRANLGVGFITTYGLGHNRILASKVLADTVLRFLQTII